MTMLGLRWAALRLVVSFVAAATVLDPAPVVGAAPTPQDIGAGGSPQVVVDAAGNAAIAWEYYNGDNYEVRFRWRSAGGSLGPIATLSAAGHEANGPQLAVDGGGRVFIVWSEWDGTSNRIRLRVRATDGSLSPSQVISGTVPDSLLPQIAVDGLGRAIIVWSEGYTNGVWLRRRSAAGSLSSIQQISDDWGTDPRVAVDAQGNATVVWVGADHSNKRIKLRRRSSSGYLNSIQTLSPAGQDADEPNVAMDAGRAIVVWERFDGTRWQVQLRRRSVRGSLSPVQTVSRIGTTGMDPDVALDAVGNAMVVFRQGSMVRLRRRSSSGYLNSIQDLSEAGQRALDPRVAIDVAGNAIVVWERFDGSTFRVQVRPRLASGGLGAIDTLSAAGDYGQHPEIGIDGSGNATVVWELFSGPDVRVQLVVL